MGRRLRSTEYVRVSYALSVWLLTISACRFDATPVFEPDGTHAVPELRGQPAAPPVMPAMPTAPDPGPMAGAAGAKEPSGGGAAGAPAPTTDAAGAAAPVMPCPDDPLETVTVDETIMVSAGAEFDGECKRYLASPALLIASGLAFGDAPLFRLEGSAHLSNVVLEPGTVDGVHTYGDATLSNVTWLNIGAVALAMRESGSVQIEGGSAAHAFGAIFRIEAGGNFRVKSVQATDARQMIRQRGGTQRVDVVIDGCDVSTMTEAIVRADSAQSRLTMTDTRYSQIAGELFIGFNPSNITLSGNTEY